MMTCFSDMMEKFFRLKYVCVYEYMCVYIFYKFRLRKS